MSLDLVRSTTNVAENNSTILDINLAFNEVCQKRQPLELNKAVSYLILATMLTLTVL